MITKASFPFHVIIINVLITDISSILLQLQDHPEKFIIEQDILINANDMLHQQDLDQVQDVSPNCDNDAVPWHLDRIDQRYLPLDCKYTPLAPSGDGVDVYIIDTGIRYSHNDLEGRAKYAGYDAVDEELTKLD